MLRFTSSFPKDWWSALLSEYETISVFQKIIPQKSIVILHKEGDFEPRILKYLWNIGKVCPFAISVCDIFYLRTLLISFFVQILFFASLPSVFKSFQHFSAAPTKNLLDGQLKAFNQSHW